MDFNTTEKNGITILHLNGKIMGGPEATEINDKINQLIDKNNKKIVIDLVNVDWMNSSGLGILIGAVTVIKNSNGILCLINVSERIENLLRITKLNTVFDIYDNFDEAAAAIG